MGNIHSYSFPEEIFLDSKNQENVNQEVYLQTSPLFDIPIEVLRLILGKLSLGEVQTVRKVCRDLRNFIDNSDIYSKLIPNLTIVVNVGSIDFIFDSIHFCVNYFQRDNGCIVIHKKKFGTFLKDADFLDIALRDFRPILMNPKTQFNYLWISTSECDVERQENFVKFLEFLENVLKSRPRPLRTKELSMRPGIQSDVLRILPYIQPKNLTKISFIPLGAKDTLNVDGIMKLEQWKEAKYVRSERSLDLATFHESFGHFKTIELHYFEFPLYGWKIFKEAMMLNPNIESILIQLHECRVASPFKNPYKEKKNKTIWLFEISKSEEKCLKISRMPYLITFERIELSEILNRAIIQI